MTDVKTMHAHLVVLGGLMVRLQVLPDKPEYSTETQPSRRKDGHAHNLRKSPAR